MKRTLLDSFNDAINGLVSSIQSQRNMQIHVVAAILVIVASLIFRLTKVEILILLVCIGSVLAAELFNTALEEAMDAKVNHFHPFIRKAKNAAAAAVFITALQAVVVGILIFWQPLTQLTFSTVSLVRTSSPYFIFAALAIVSLLVLLIKAKFGEGTPLRGGMPSGHTAVAFAVATMMSFLTVNPIVMTLSFMLALIVAQSRVDSRVHTFYEVASGALLGFLVTAALFRLFQF
ncbi:Diacylglycerol kinase [Clostridiaceae bacterium JG1575]|nr:Diacylglycerol kinase [Clostridiaceae bacterium JG1575]